MAKKPRQTEYLREHEHRQLRPLPEAAILRPDPMPDATVLAPAAPNARGHHSA
jgi:hypothetical protein